MSTVDHVLTAKLKIVMDILYAAVGEDDYINELIGKSYRLVREADNRTAQRIQFGDEYRGPQPT